MFLITSPFRKCFDYSVRYGAKCMQLTVKLFRKYGESQLNSEIYVETQ